jgi:hypothetical protein
MVKQTQKGKTLKGIEKKLLTRRRNDATKCKFLKGCCSRADPVDGPDSISALFNVASLRRRVKPFLRLLVLKTGICCRDAERIN